MPKSSALCSLKPQPFALRRFSKYLTFLHFFPNKAVVTLQPNWIEVYRGERITLRCEIKDGGDTEWKYEWRTTSSEKPSDQNEHRITSVTESHSGDYRCKGRKKHTQHSSTDWSDPIKLTVSYGKHTQHDIVAELEEEIQSINLLSVPLSLSGLQVSLFLVQMLF
uniref:Ig-like domain-containing protein n=1 Tax=Sparus aurata TaxID=8175 RepID=A0A671TLC4_SPAAU